MNNLIKLTLIVGVLYLIPLHAEEHRGGEHRGDFQGQSQDHRDQMNHDQNNQMQRDHDNQDRDRSDKDRINRNVNINSTSGDVNLDVENYNPDYNDD